MFGGGEKGNCGGCGRVAEKLGAAETMMTYLLYWRRDLFFFFFLFYFLTALSGRQRSSKIVPAVCEGVSVVW